MDDKMLTPEVQAELAKLQLALPMAQAQFLDAVRNSVSPHDRGATAAVKRAAVKLKEADLTAFVIQERISQILTANDR
jgi:hypothetical protein